MGYFDALLGYEWELTTSPSGHQQWTPTAASNAEQPPAAHDPSRTEPLMMTTADMALKMDPEYAKISAHFHSHPDEFADAYARAWFKLTHRDMGPKSRYVGEEVPAEDLIWQDPIPTNEGSTITPEEVGQLKQRLLASGLSTVELVETAWASASTYRNSDKRGGANGARIRLAPQKDWAANKPAQLQKVLDVLEGIRTEFNSSGSQVSIADLIVLGGSAAIEQAAGGQVEVPFTAGRADALDAQTDAASFSVLEPVADGFRNYRHTSDPRSTEALLVDKAALLTLTAPEMTVLVGGLRALGVTSGADEEGFAPGVLTEKPGTLSNDYFVNLLNPNVSWSADDASEETFTGRDRSTGEVQWRARRADLVFGSNSILRGLAEVYAADDARQKFALDFAAAWTKVMNLDRFDLSA